MSSSSSSIQQVRPVIECFCQILSLYGFSSITPEIFRLAKFNRDEAVESLWRLIYELLNFDRTNFSSQKLSIDRFNKTKKNQLVTTMKNDLFTRGFISQEFLLLDDEMRKGSRQLLLCFGWLIYQMKFIEILSNESVQSDSIFDFDDTSALYANSFVSSSTKSKNVENSTLVGQVKDAMRMNSKLRFALRRLHGLVIENAHLQHQVHQCHNMSSLEAFLCQRPHLLSHYMIELDLEYRRLSLLNFWTENESVFWKWMESVLDQIPPVEEEDEEEEKFQPLTQTDSQRLNAAIDTLNNALNRLNEFSTHNEEFDEEMSSLFGQWLTSHRSMTKTNSSDEKYFLHQPQRLVYSKSTEIKDEQQRISREKDFQNETKRLNEFRSKIDENIEEQRKILDNLSNKFDHVMIV